MSKQIDHDKLNDFFGDASEFADHVERYRAHEQALSEEADAAAKQEIRKQMADDRRAIKKLLPTIEAELVDVLPFRRDDGGVINEVQAKMQFVKEQILGDMAA